MAKYILQSKRTPKPAAPKPPAKKEPAGQAVHTSTNTMTRAVKKPGPVRYGNF